MIRRRLPTWDFAAGVLFVVGWLLVAKYWGTPWRWLILMGMAVILGVSFYRGWKSKPSDKPHELQNLEK
jgi:hypothetical protein